MSVITFLLLLVIAAIAAGAQIVIGGSPPELRGRAFGALFVAYALLPALLGG